MLRKSDAPAALPDPLCVASAELDPSEPESRESYSPPRQTHECPRVVYSCPRSAGARPNNPPNGPGLPCAIAAAGIISSGRDAKT